LAAERGTSKSRGSTARPGRWAPGVLTTTVQITILEQDGCRTKERRAVAVARQCPFYVSLCFSASRCGVQVPFPLNSHYAERLEEGLEDWKTGSLEVRKEKTIRVTADKRTTREQMIPNSQTSPLNQCPASHSAFNHPFVCAEQSARTSGSKESLKRSQPPPPDHALIPSPFASKFRISVDFEGFFSFPCRMLCRDWPRSGADRQS
jgi:hypothetical protein